MNAHPNAHVIDSALFRDQFGTPEMRAVFSDRATIQRWLDVEAALARVEARLGVIPEEAAHAISEAARVERLDIAELKRGVDETSHPLVPLINQLARACPDDLGEYVHWGATTQDIMDTAVVLQLRDALAILERQLEDLVAVLAGLADRHRATPMAGRTHGQHALPITLGFKLAVFIAELQRHRDRLHELRPRLLVVQLSGAVGTLAALGGLGRAVQEALAEELGLGVPPITWHPARDGFAEFTCLAAMIGQTCARAANEVILLQKTEVGELEEPHTEHSVGSSTMPQKRNPMLCEAIVAVGRILAAQPAIAVGSLVHQHERDMSAWQAEWAFIPETAILASGALANTHHVFENLTVRPDRMRANLGITNGLINAEAVMISLAERIGRQRAHSLVRRAARTSFESGRPFADCLLETPEVLEHLDRARIEALLQPEAYLGEALAAVDRVLDQVRPLPRSVAR
jgi:3-carboxy-cis,cis-muconate cycloisomerase